MVEERAQNKFTDNPPFPGLLENVVGFLWAFAGGGAVTTADLLLESWRDAVPAGHHGRRRRCDL